jgi:1-aminocyclopropane-1-carboxylate deaminase/D-cysteine desulfhydrase-like pyridoxal-dependent ACC family enzyme
VVGVTVAGMFREDTPIERYRVGTYWVRVKRDDLYAAPPAPPLAKLRGAMSLLATLHSQGVRLVGCWDTRISALGQGIVACCASFPGMHVVVAYPKTKGSNTPDPIARARKLGAEILPVVAGRITISFAAARREVERRGGVMLPFGLECAESVSAVARAAATVPPAYTSSGTVVVSSGSGVTLAGLILGLSGRPTRFIGVSSGRSIDSIQRCLNRHGITECERIQLVPAREAYDVPVDFECPFPSHPNYDRKAWRFLAENAGSLQRPLFFWNVGA